MQYHWRPPRPTKRPPSLSRKIQKPNPCSSQCADVLREAILGDIVRQDLAVGENRLHHLGMEMKLADLGIVDGAERSAAIRGVVKHSIPAFTGSILVAVMASLSTSKEEGDSHVFYLFFIGWSIAMR